MHGGDIAATTEMEVVAAHVQSSVFAYQKLANCADESKFNRCIVNPATQELEFAGLRTTTLRLSRFDGKSLCEAAEYVIENYWQSHHIPGVEYLRWLYHKPYESPKNLRSVGNQSLVFIGSVMHGLEWTVPCATWAGDRFLRGAERLSRVYGPDYRIVLLEKLD